MIDLRRPPQVAQSIAETPEIRVHLADHLRPQAGTQPIAPNWVYRTIAWGLAQKLAFRGQFVTAHRRATPGRQGQADRS